MTKNKQYCVIGLGRFGNEVARNLMESGQNVMVIDKEPELIEAASKKFDVAFVCDASNVDALIETGIQNTRTVIVAISSVEDSISICAALREIGIKDIIAKAKNVVHKRILKTMGIPRIVIPDIEIGRKIALQALFNIGVDIMSIGSDFSWIRIVINNDAIVNKPLFKLKLNTNYDATIMLIQRQGEVIFPPTKDTELKNGDVVTFITKSKSAKKIINYLNVDFS